MILKEINSFQSCIEWQKSDPHLQELKTSPFRWRWPCLDTILELLDFSKDSASKGRVHILRGPRQVGKTTLVKSVIVEKMKNHKGPVPRTIFVQGDWIENFRQLDDVLRPHLNRVDFVVIDEITFIDQWQRAVKGWYDEGISRRIQFLLTGSNAFDLKRQAELLPGRRGKGKDFELLPMSFQEYFENCASVLKVQDPGQVFSVFLQTGGFPQAIREYIATKQVEESQETYLRWIRGDFLKAGKSDTLLQELFSALLKVETLPVGLDDLRARSSFGSHNTVREYLEFAESAFVLFGVSRIETNKWLFFPKKNKKYYFRDPLIAIIAHSWARVQVNPVFTQAYLCESVIAEEFHRKGIQFGYWHDKKKNEVDFVSKELALEVKSGIDPSLPAQLSKLKHKNKFLVHMGSKRELIRAEHGNVQVLPIWEFLRNGTCAS